MRTADDIRQEVETTLEGFENEHDINAIVDDLKDALAFDARAGYAGIDTLDSGEYWEIVKRHSI